MLSIITPDIWQIIFDETEYNKIYNENYRSIYIFCLSRLHDNEYAEEATNDVMVELYKHWQRLNKSDKIKSWLYSVASNVIKRKQEKSIFKHANINSLEELYNKGNLLTDEYYNFDFYPENETFDLENELNSVLQMLPIEYREIFSLYFLEKRTLMNISKSIDIPYSTVRYKICKSKAIAKTIIKDKYR